MGMGAWPKKSLERCCRKTACLRRGPKIIYSYYTRCALIRDRQRVSVFRDLQMVVLEISKSLYYLVSSKKQFL